MEKTCGNCDSWRTVGIERGYCILDNSLEDGCAKLHLRDDAACDKHTDAPLPLEQLYQQLADVAREMWHYVVAHNTPNVPGVDMSVFEARLEELGVEV